MPKFTYKLLLVRMFWSRMVDFCPSTARKICVRGSVLFCAINPSLRKLQTVLRRAKRRQTRFGRMRWTVPKTPRRGASRPFVAKIGARGTINLLRCSALCLLINDMQQGHHKNSTQSCGRWCQWYV